MTLPATATSRLEDDREQTVALLSDASQPDRSSLSQYPPSSAPPPPSSSRPQSEDTKQCRICGMEEDEEEEDEDPNRDEEQMIDQPSKRQDEQALLPASSKSKRNPLIRPCRCKGSMMYVHVDCLNQWRIMSPRQESYVACDLCGYRYNIHRPRYAALISHPYFLRTLTIMLVLGFTLAMSYACKAIDVYGLHHVPQPDDEKWHELHGPTILWMDRIYLLAGLFFVSIFGILYLVYLCATATTATTTAHATSSVSCLFCDQTTCPWYGCYLADFTACSGDAALGGLLVLAAFVAITTIVFGVIGVFSGVYAMMESIVENVAGRVKERILEVNQ